MKADIVNAPMAKESPVNMECRVIHIITFGQGPVTNSLILGTVLRVHITDQYWNGATRRIAGLQPIARLGGAGDIYGRSGDTFQMPRPVI